MEIKKCFRCGETKETTQIGFPGDYSFYDCCKKCCEKIWLGRERTRSIDEEEQHAWNVSAL